jgi:TPR repeat protein
MLKSSVYALALAVALVGSAAAGPFEDGTAAYQKGDFATALRLMRQLADQGIAKAQYALGVMYYNGQGVPQDYAQAVNWYRKAADQGLAVAQFNLAIMYYTGEGVPQDYAQAFSWYRKAADQGHAKAQYNLAIMYNNGLGVPQDYIQAHMWANLAASRFTDPTDRADAVKNRDLYASKMTPAQIAEAQRLASAWKPK